MEKSTGRQKTGHVSGRHELRQKNVVAVGDPLNGRLYLAESTDEGKTWKQTTDPPLSQSGCFASSGTNVAWKKPGYVTVTGGVESSIYWRGYVFPLPITQGTASTGANSIAVNPDNNGAIAAVAVGGDFDNKEISDSNCVLVPKTFFEKPDPALLAQPVQSPKGYKSCVVFVDGQKLVATGTSCTDVSEDQGYHWKHLSDLPFHTVQKAKNGHLVLLAGPNGTVARLEL